MSEGTLRPSIAEAGIHRDTFEVSMSVLTGSWRNAVRLDSVARIAAYKTMFGSIVVEKIEAEVRQDTLAGGTNSTLCPSGHIYVAIIPSGKNTDAAAGTSADVINRVRNKQTFALSSIQQNNMLFNFDLEGFEVDLAQDPRKQQGVVLWIGNSGVTVYANQAEKMICTATFRCTIACTGKSTLW